MVDLVNAQCLQSTPYRYLQATMIPNPYTQTDTFNTKLDLREFNICVRLLSDKLSVSGNYETFKFIQAQSMKLNRLMLRDSDRNLIRFVRGSHGSVIY